MIINELILSSFGKFNNKKINLSQGINIIYGSNESGKTTIHKFIEGMFYGFFKSYTKRKIYLDDYNKYFPWEQNDYYGVLKYSEDNDVYRIERNFVKSNDEVKIFDDKTGEDISHLFEYDGTTRLYQPSSLHLGLNSVVYNNTISIKQLSSKTEEDLAKEVKDSLINLGGSLDEDISIKGVIEKLDKRTHSIGTKARVKTSPYGKVIEELENLEIERKRATKLYEEIKEHQLRLNKIKSEVITLKDERKDIEDKISLLEGLKNKERYHEAIGLMEEIEELNKEYITLKEYDRLNPYQYTEGVKLEGTISTLNESLEELNNKYEKLSLRYKRLNNRLNEFDKFKGLEDRDEIGNIDITYKVLEDKKRELIELQDNITKLDNKIKNSDKDSLKKLNEDYYRFEELEEKRNNILYSKDHTNISFIVSRLEEKQSHYKRLNAYKIGALVGIIVSVFLGVNYDIRLLGIGVLPIFLMIYSFILSREIRKYIYKLKRQMEDIEKKESIRDEKVQNIDIEMDRILSTHNIRNKGEFRRLIGEYSMEIALASDNENKINQYISKLKDLKKEIDKLRESILKYLNLLDNCKEISLDNINEFKTKYNKYKELLNSKESIKREMKDLGEEISLVEGKLNKNKESLSSILSNNNLESMVDFKDGIDKKQKFEAISGAKENKERLLKKVLGDNSINYLNQKASKYMDIKSCDIRGLKKDDLEDKLKGIEKDIRSKNQDITRLEEKISNLSSTTKSLVDIDEDIRRKKRIKIDFEKKLKSLELAKSTINKISKEIQRDFAPKLNNKVSDIIKNITNYKYSEVKITENIDIKVTDPTNGRFIEVDKLSGGTIDQLYFATRLGIIDIIKDKNNIPLILDDCFTQYDINRLKNILSYLSQEGIKRQIILLTCHKREKEVFDKMGVKYNYIDIS